MITFSNVGWANFYGSADTTNVARHNWLLARIKMIEALQDELTWRIADAFFGEKRTQEIPQKIENALVLDLGIDMTGPEIRFRLLHAFRDAAYQIIRDYYPNTPNAISFRAKEFGLKIIFSMRDYVVSPKTEE